MIPINYKSYFKVHLCFMKTSVSQNVKISSYYCTKKDSVGFYFTPVILQCSSLLGLSVLSVSYPIFCFHIMTTFQWLFKLSVWWQNLAIFEIQRFTKKETGTLYCEYKPFGHLVQALHCYGVSAGISYS